MDILRASDLDRLAEAGPGPCVSITLPTHRAGPQVRQGPIRLRNLLHEADERLRGLGLRSPEAAELLRPLAELLDEPAFWNFQSDALAAFARPGWSTSFRLPLPMDERVTVGDRFHLKPLLPYVEGGRFFVLVLSRDDVRLFEGSRFALEQVEARDVPRSLAEALHVEDLERELQLHVSGGGPARRAIYHGHGAGREIERERLVRFLREVDRGLAEILRDERAPLVLAGVEENVAVFREVSSYPKIAPEAIGGDPGDRSNAALRERAWAVVEPLFGRTLDADRERFHELDGTGRTARELAEVVGSARDGRVEVLFAAADQERWGAVTEDGIEIRDEPQPGDEDLVDAAVVAGLATGARIHVLPEPDLPAAPVSAILRY